ncbi:hypothetical protein NDU88_005054 [Pleurodeles waltl]|uniref:Uncharacterized protein n=1 Tax=Pleurodeles waltl TaxID=8319 RepID=A0AAV7RMP9_PLEWA|nr:hypothetical protein NDU88_005054 [Pleurodeles waltl]
MWISPLSHPTVVDKQRYNQWYRRRPFCQRLTLAGRAVQRPAADAQLWPSFGRDRAVQRWSERRCPVPIGAAKAVKTPVLRAEARVP